MIARLFPVLIFVALGILLAFGLRIADHKTEIPSPLIGKPARSWIQPEPLGVVFRRAQRALLHSH